MNLILASSSEIRAHLLRQAAVPFEQKNLRVDEESMKEALIAEGASPRDIADSLAELKARRADRGDGFVLGCDQILALDQRIYSKPSTPAEACSQLSELSGKRHTLFSAAVIYENGKPVWRHVSEAHLTMRTLTAAFIERYADRNWDSIKHSVGGYKIEEEGARLFAQISGDTFTIQGLPLLPLLNYLILRGIIDG